MGITTTHRRIVRQLNELHRRYSNRLTGCWALFDANGNYLGYRDQSVRHDGIDEAIRVRILHDQPWTAARIADGFEHGLAVVPGHVSLSHPNA